MKISRNYKKDVYCLEGDWDSDLRSTSSVHAAMLFLQNNIGIKFIHRHCGTKESLAHYLKLWKSKKYSKYSICYFAFHGEPENLAVGKELVSLDELGEMLEGACKDRIIHFGSCKTLNTEKRNVMRFLNKTGALCVCGFKTEIDFLESSVFDMLLIDKFQQYKDVSCVDRDMNLYHENMVKNLEFKIFYA